MAQNKYLERQNSGLKELMRSKANKPFQSSPGHEQVGQKFRTKKSDIENRTKIGQKSDMKSDQKIRKKSDNNVSDKNIGQKSDMKSDKKSDI